MRRPSYSSQFKRDVKLAQKRGKDMPKLRRVIELLLAGTAPISSVGSGAPKQGATGY